MGGISLKPSEMVEGGAVPVEQNLLWKSARFALFDYGGKAPQTTAACITLVNDDGQEYIQYYSAADPARFVPSEDGKKLVAVGVAASLSKSSNFFLLMNALISAGFPENKLGEDISVLDGLYAFHIGLPEPKRAGLEKAAPADGSVARAKVLSVPSQIHRMPWEKAKAGAKPAAAPKKAAAVAAAPAESEGEDINALAVAFVAKAIGDEGSITRQQLAVKVFKDLAKDPNRDAIASAVFAPEFQAALMGAGFKVSGETISK